MQLNEAHANRNHLKTCKNDSHQHLRKIYIGLNKPQPKQNGKQSISVKLKEHFQLGSHKDLKLLTINPNIKQMHKNRDSHLSHINFKRSNTTQSGASINIQPNRDKSCTHRKKLICGPTYIYRNHPNFEFENSQNESASCRTYNTIAKHSTKNESMKSIKSTSKSKKEISQSNHQQQHHQKMSLYGSFSHASLKLNNSIYNSQLGSSDWTFNFLHSLFEDLNNFTKELATESTIMKFVDEIILKTGFEVSKAIKAHFQQVWLRFLTYCRNLNHEQRESSKSIKLKKCGLNNDKDDKSLLKTINNFQICDKKEALLLSTIEKLTIKVNLLKKKLIDYDILLRSEEQKVIKLQEDYELMKTKFELTLNELEDIKFKERLNQSEGTQDQIKMYNFKQIIRDYKLLEEDNSNLRVELGKLNEDLNERKEKEYKIMRLLFYLHNNGLNVVDIMENEILSDVKNKDFMTSDSKFHELSTKSFNTFHSEDHFNFIPSDIDGEEYSSTGPKGTPLIDIKINFGESQIDNGMTAESLKANSNPLKNEPISSFQKKLEDNQARLMAKTPKFANSSLNAIQQTSNNSGKGSSKVMSRFAHFQPKLNLNNVDKEIKSDGTPVSLKGCYKFRLSNRAQKNLVSLTGKLNNEFFDLNKKPKGKLEG